MSLALNRVGLDRATAGGRLPGHPPHSSALARPRQAPLAMTLLRTLFLACACFLALLGGPQVALAEASWRTCANEGEVCNVANRGIVRYGVPGQWATRSVRGSVACTNEVFGDAAPGMPKRCETTGSDGSSGGGGNDPDWAFCAPEGQTCRFNGSAEVRFGNGDSYTIRRAYGSVRCDVRDFGDPAYGVTKHCDVRRTSSGGGGWGGSGGSGGSGDSWGGGGGNWRYCAAEDQVCRINGRAQVRFGDGQRFVTRTYSGEVPCSVSRFGDPAYGVRKHCEVQSSGWGGSGGSSEWRRCAREGDRCSFDGRTQVRFGVDGRYYYRDAWGGVQCVTDSFGGDPYPNRKKTCEIRQ